MSRPGRLRVLSSGALLGLAALLAFSPQPAAAQGNRPANVSPLPASNYSVRRVCPPPTPGHASCLSLELIPVTASARAHTHPLGMARSAPVGAGNAAAICEPPSAAEGCYGLRPQDLHSAYVLPTATEASATQTIALVEAYNDPNAEADLKFYDKEFGLPECTKTNGCFTQLNQEGHEGPLPQTEGGWALEISLDIETAHAICQNCHLMLIEASSESFADLDAAEARAAELGATEISNSWGGEAPSTDGPAFNHPGIAITAAAGDDGYLNWDAEALLEKGFADYPAASPHVIAVGGTRLSLEAGTGAWKEETVWNDGSSVNEGVGVTGGGCSDFTAPSWQREVSDWSQLGCGSARAVTDVSADGDPYTGLAVYDSTPYPTPFGEEVLDWVPIGGTSLGTPLVAATFALAGGAHGVEYPAQTLYSHLRSGSLHDITSGSNGECDKSFNELTGLSGCTAAEEEQASCPEHHLVCGAGPGYDGPSGVGTPDGLGAFQRPSQPSKEAQTIEFTSAAPSSANVGGPTYTVSASASSGLPVVLTSATPSVCSMTGSTLSFSATGTCTIDANQPGDADYEAAPQAEQSFTVAGAPALTPPPSTSVPALTSPNALTSPLIQAPDSNFNLFSTPSIDLKSGAITFTVLVADPGTLTWLLRFQNGQFGAFSASRRKCNSGQIRLKGKCRPATILFGQGAEAVTTAGTASFTVKPTASARTALANARKQGMGLPVTALLTFQSSLGGSAASHARSITVKLGKMRSKGASRSRG